jgi:DNA-binding response OmpR family regulator
VALKILLADDSTTAQNMGKKILMEAGYEVVTASNGAAAVKKIAEQKPDIIVLDVYMPGYTGLEVCERVKSAIETTKTPVLLTVGKMEVFKAEDGARVKADGLIVKPFEASDLLAAIKKLEQRLNSSIPKAKVMVTPAEPPSDEPPEYERTLKMKTPVFDEKDASYQSWKSETDENAPAEQPAATAAAGVELPEEDFPSASAEEPHTVNVPTEMRAAPAMGMEHLGSDLPPGSEQTTTELLDHNTAFLERSTVEVDPYQIVEEGGDGSTPKSGAGRFYSKAKSWFGGASALEGYEVAPGETEAETITLDPGHAEEALQTLAPVPRPAASPASGHAAAAPSQEEGSAHDLDMESAQDIPVEAVPTEVSDLHLSAVVSSWEPDAAAPVEASVHEPELEVVSSSQEHVSSGTTPDLEVTSQPSSGDVAAGATSDSMLVTDVSEMSAQFPTRFGVEGAEPVPVGNAADYPELYGHPAGEAHGAVSSIEDTQEIDTPAELQEEPGQSKPESDHPEDFAAQVAATVGPGWSEKAHADAELSRSHDTHEPSLSGWSAEETHLEENEIGVSLHEEMQQQFSGAPAAGEPGPAASSENGPDAQLAAAMAAAMGTEVTPALTEAVHQAFTGDSTMALDKNTAVIAEIVHRVTERMKPELVAEIARELALEIKKKKE